MFCVVQEMEQRQRDSIMQRMEKQEAKQANDHAEKKKKQAEWRNYLMKQAEDLRQRRNQVSPCMMGPHTKSACPTLC